MKKTYLQQLKVAQLPVPSHVDFLFFFADNKNKVKNMRG